MKAITVKWGRLTYLILLSIGVFAWLGWRGVAVVALASVEVTRS